MFSDFSSATSHPQSTPFQTNFFQNRSYQLPYLPQTPSPLRTSRNVNLMPPPSTPGIKSSPLSENTFSYDFSSPIQSTEYGNENEDVTPPSDTSSLAFDKNTPPIFSLAKSTQDSHFATRARSSSPQALLNSAASSARDRRKSLFLDRIRQRRDDDRFGDKGDQVLRMDWVREQREREERLARKATDASLGLNEDDLMGALEQEENNENRRGEEMSPTEEWEIEELLSYMPESYTNSNDNESYSLSQDSRQQTAWMGAQPAPRLTSELSDDEDYDQLFMEMDIETSTGPGGIGVNNLGESSKGQGTFTSEQWNSSMDTTMHMDIS